MRAGKGQRRLQAGRRECPRCRRFNAVGGAQLAVVNGGRGRVRLGGGGRWWDSPGRWWCVFDEVRLKLATAGGWWHMDFAEWWGWPPVGFWWGRLGGPPCPKSRGASGRPGRQTRPDDSISLSTSSGPKPKEATKNVINARFWHRACQLTRSCHPAPLAFLSSEEEIVRGSLSRLEDLAARLNEKRIKIPSFST